VLFAGEDEWDSGQGKPPEPGSELRDAVVQQPMATGQQTEVVKHTIRAVRTLRKPDSSEETARVAMG